MSELYCPAPFPLKAALRDSGKHPCSERSDRSSEPRPPPRGVWSSSGGLNLDQQKAPEPVSPRIFGANPTKRQRADEYPEFLFLANLGGADALGFDLSGGQVTVMLGRVSGC